MRRMSMSHGFACVLALTLACQPAGPPTGDPASGASDKGLPDLSASMQVSVVLPGSPAARIVPTDVARVQVQISWTGGQTPLLDMTKTGPVQFELVIGNLPANTPCIVRAQALDAQSSILYEAETPNVTFAPNLQTPVTLNLVAVDDGLHQGAAPRVISVRRPGTPVQSGNLVDLEFSVGDADDARLSYALQNPAGGSFDKSAGEIALTEGAALLKIKYTAPGNAGPAPIIIQLTDASGLIATFSFTLTIQDEPVDPDPTAAGTKVNFPPVIETISATRVGDEIAIEALVSDDGPASELSFQWYRGGISVGSANPVKIDATGDVVTLALAVQDGPGASASLSFDLNTASTLLWHTPNQNEPPVVLTATQSQNGVSYGDTVLLEIHVTDADGDPLDAQWSASRGTIDGLSSETQGQTRIFRAKWHAAVTAGLAHITVKVSDTSKAWAAYVFPISQVLGRVNIIANAGTDQESLLGGTATLNSSGSSSEDGSIVSYQWSKVSGPASTLATPNAAVTTVQFTTIGTYRYRLTVNNINNSATAEVQVLVTDPSAFMFELAEATDAGSVYFLNRADLKVHRYDIPSGQFLPPWKTRSQVMTMAVAPEGNAVYVGYTGGAIDVFNTITGERSFFSAGSDTALSMIIVGKYLFLIERVGGTATYGTFDRTTGSRAGNSSPGYYYSSQYLGVARSLNRVFHFRDGTSPNDIHRVDINPSTGQLSNYNESPYHGSFGFSPPIRMFPDESKVIVGSGAIFATSDLTTAGNFGRSYVDMGFFGPNAHLISKSGTKTQVDIFDTNLAIQASKFFDGDPLRVFLHQNKFVLVTKQAERIVRIQVANLPLP